MDYKKLLGDKWTQELEDTIKKDVGAEFVAKTDFNTVNQAKKTLETDLAARDKEVETLKAKSGDETTLTATIAQLKADQEAAKTAHDAELAAVRRDAAVELALLTARARNPKAAMALINTEAIKLEDGKLTGLDEQLKALKTSDAYLFEDEKSKNPPLRGVAPAEGGDPGGAAPQTLAQAVEAHFSTQKG